MIFPLKSNFSRWSIAIFTLSMILGIYFRFANLDRKIYWHDEVYTTIRTTGYRADDIFGQFFQNHFLSSEEIKKFQQLKPDSTPLDTIQSLAIEDPQHPPLYFLLSRYWEILFGFNIVSSRVVAIGFSLLGLPVIYWLSLELFPSRLTAILATIFLALSPIDILFSQIARQYSLLTLLTILGQLFLLKAIRSNRFKFWSLYSIVTALGLYTHLFFVLNFITQGIFTLVYALLRKDEKQKLVSFAIAAVGSIILYIPWLIVFLQNAQRAFTSTNWSKVNSIDWGWFTKLWIFSFTNSFIDSGFGSDNLSTFLIRFPFLLGIALAFYLLYRKSDRVTFYFLFLSSFAPWLLLFIPDVIFQTNRSTITRYLIACFPSLCIAVAFLATDKLFRGQKIWKALFALWIVATLVSNYHNARSETTWAKPPSSWNGEIVRRINAADRAIVISDRGDDWTNLGDIISLNYHARPEVRYYLTWNPPDLEKLRSILDDRSASIFLFRPSSELLSAFIEFDIALDRFPPDYQLWQVIR